MKKKQIIIKGANQNNLKNVDVTIPKYQLNIITGISGSGKSSLVFDTLASESRRELNETFPSFLQQYLPKYGKPDVVKINNLPVAIIVDQKRLADNVRSTLATYTDIYSYLRLLYSRFGSPNIGYSNVFSFNHPKGKCPECDGLGFVTTMDIHKLVDFNKSLNENPIDFPTFGQGFWRWKRYADSGLFDLDKKIKDYSEKEMDLFLNSPQIKLKNPPYYWPPTALYEGIIPRMKRSILGNNNAKRHKKYVDKFVTTGICPSCHGTRLNEKVRSCKINDKSIADIILEPLDQVLPFLMNLNFPKSKEVKDELIKRVQSLIDIGLGYLNLARNSDTLSGGEIQRVKISKYINTSLNDLMFILDEPSIGLHPKDIDRLKNALFKLKDVGNTVILVEHNAELIKVADYIIDMGPKAGKDGGEVLFSGLYKDFLKSKSITSLAIQKKIEIKKDTPQPNKWFSIENISVNNLKNINVKIPLGVMTVICGVAGSGKSSLLRAIKNELQDEHKVIDVSQKNIGANIRSTPLTYLGVFGEIRSLFSKANKVSASYFSYNAKGACPHCKGKGVVISDMSFMDDVVTDCEVCDGKRYDPKVLKYTYKEKSIVDVLNMSIKESTSFFDDVPSLVNSFQTLEAVGLGYMHLNQSLSTLSGGELQRMKLASHLQEESSIYILDEPTTGLHLNDIDHLLFLFNQLVKKGNTLIISEHHLSLIKNADYIIEVGPEAGNKGGQITFTGTPLELVKSDDNITKPYLI